MVWGTGVEVLTLIILMVRQKCVCSGNIINKIIRIKSEIYIIKFMLIVS